MTGSVVTLALVALFCAGLFLVVPARVIAGGLRTVIPGLLIVAGTVLLLTGRGGVGGVLIFVGAGLWRRMRGVTGFGGGFGTSGQGAPKASSVRSAALEMELNHDTGAMNGVVLAGAHSGRELDDMDRSELLDLYDEVRDDGESVALLDAYLDRRFPTWRENAEFDAGAGQGSAARSGPMGEEEAYEVLGLSPGASPEQIRQAHRRLMKRAHPDSGGSTFLAAKINEAKDVLLKKHT